MDINLRKNRHDQFVKTRAVEEDLDQKLKFREQDLHIAHRKTLALKYFPYTFNLSTQIKHTRIYRREISEKEQKISELVDRVSIYEKDFATIDSEKMEIRLQFIQREQELESKVASLTDSLNQANGIVDKLSVFKSTFADVDIAKDEKVFIRNARDLEITPRSMLDYDVIEAEKLNYQLAEMIDYQLGSQMLKDFLTLFALFQMNMNIR